MPMSALYEPTYCRSSSKPPAERFAPQSSLSPLWPGNYTAPRPSLTLYPAITSQNIAAKPISPVRLLSLRPVSVPATISGIAAAKTSSDC